jgi:hypothetical protein
MYPEERECEAPIADRVFEKNVTTFWYDTETRKIVRARDVSGDYAGERKVSEDGGYYFAGGDSSKGVTIAQNVLGHHWPRYFVHNLGYFRLTCLAGM